MEKRTAREDNGISKLPEAIVHHILSFLTPNEAAKTRLLSKAWLCAWQTSPVIRFRQPNFRNRSDPEVCKALFLNFVNKVLLNYREHNNGISSFKLEMEFDYDSSKLVDKWIKIAAENGLKKLHLRGYMAYALLRVTLEAQFLEELILSGFKFQQRAIKGVMCNNLRRLVLGNVCLSDKVFQEIISNCRLIENLMMHDCKGLRSIKVINLAKLNKFSVSSVLKQLNVEVEAPNLESLRCSIGSLGDKWIPGMVNLFASQNLKLLELDGVGITDTFFINFTIMFPHIEELRISSCNCIHRVKISSQTLRTIKLFDNEKLEELQVDAPKIVRFEYIGHVIAPVLITTASSHWESEICLHCLHAIGNSWFLKLKEMLTNLTKSKIFLHISSRDYVAFNPNEIGDDQTNFRPEIETLSLSVAHFELQSSKSDLLNGCFWSFRPKFIHQQWLFRGTINLTKFLLRLLMISRDEQLKNFQETEFWFTDLKDVRVEILKLTGSDGWQPVLVDWSFLLDSGSTERAIRFNLEWS